MSRPTQLVVAVSLIALLAVSVEEIVLGQGIAFERHKWLEYGTQVYSDWTPYQRVDVVDLRGNQLDVYEDGWFYYPVCRFTPEPLLDQNKVLISVLQQENVRRGSVLIIGSGLGQDIAATRSASLWDRGVWPQVTAVELDPGQVRAAQNFPWLWKIYRTASVHIGEGRYFLETGNDPFDLIYLASVDTRALVSSVAIPEANFLYTSQAFRRIYERLNDGGYFVMRRVLPLHKEQLVHDCLVQTVREAGIPLQNVVFCRHHKTVRAAMVEMAMEQMIIRKTKPLTSPIKDLMFFGAAPGEFVNQPVIETTGEVGNHAVATTDTYPFPLELDRGMATTDTQRIGAWILPLAALGLLLLLFGTYSKQSLQPYTGAVTLFTIGIAYMVLESSVLFNCFLLLGNPSLSTGIGLGMFLLGNGIGGMVSQKWLDQLVGKRFIVLIFATLLALLVYSLLAPTFMAATMRWYPLLRMLLMSCIIIPAGIAAGLFFPAALNTFKNRPIGGLFAVNLVGNALGPVVFWMLFLRLGLGATVEALMLLYGCAAAALCYVSHRNAKNVAV